MTRPDRLNVVVDASPGRHPVESPEIGWWLPILGPTTTVLAVTLVADARTGHTRWDTADLTRRIGLGRNRSKLWASLERLQSFGCGHFASTDVIVVRAELHELTARQQLALPDSLAARYPATSSAEQCGMSWPSVFTGDARRPTHSPPDAAPDCHLRAGYEERTSGEAG